MKYFFNNVLLLIVFTAVAAGLYFYNDFQGSSDTLTCNLQGKVIRVVDGDSVTVLDKQNEQHKIRLAGIDTPERKQPYGKVARQFLAKHIYKQQVCVGWYKRDKYQRLVGVIRIEDEEINLKLVKAGLAWHYKQYENEQSKSDRVLYAKAHEKAEASEVGLWRDSRPIAPWLWRRGAR